MKKEVLDALRAAEGKRPQEEPVEGNEPCRPSGPSPEKECAAAEKAFDAEYGREAIRAHLEGLFLQAAALTDFDLAEALRDPAFVRLTAPGVGVPVEDAWYALHRRESQQRDEKERQRMLARAFAAASRRPKEGGSGAAALIAADYRSLSRQEQLAVKKRIAEAGARGEKMYP